MATKAAPLPASDPSKPVQSAESASAGTSLPTAKSAPPAQAGRRSRARSDYPKFGELHWLMLLILESAPPNGHAADTIQVRAEQTMRRRRELAEGQTLLLGHIYEDLLDGAIAYAECCDHEGVKAIKGTRVRLTAAGQSAVAKYKLDPAAAQAALDELAGPDEDESGVEDDGATLKRRGG
jgi:hypothetical protein